MESETLSFFVNKTLVLFDDIMAMEVHAGHDTYPIMSIISFKIKIFQIFVVFAQHNISNAHRAT